jgi:O-acetyl-ADP-ribose deacetylase (regulator of RNase III)
MKLVKQRFPGRRIGYPRIGAGLGRGDWARLAQIIDEELLDEDHTLVEFVARRDQAAG